MLSPEDKVLKELEKEKGTYRSSPVSDGEALVGITLFSLVFIIGNYKKLTEYDRELSIKFDLYLSRPQGIKNLNQLIDEIKKKYLNIKNENFPRKTMIENMEVKASYMDIVKGNLYVVVKCEADGIGEWYSAHNLTVGNWFVIGKDRRELIKTVKGKNIIYRFSI